MFAALDAEAYDREYSDRELTRRFLGYFARYRRRNIALVVSTAVLATLNAALPIVISRAVNWLAYRQPAALVLVSVVWAVLVLWVCIWLSNYVRRRVTAHIIGDVVLALRSDAFVAAMGHDLAFYDRFAAGRVVSRITSDTQDLGQTVNLLSDLISQTVTMVILGVVLFTISPRLTVLLLAWAPIIMLLALAWRRAAREVTRQGSRVMAEVNAKILETVSGIAIAKNFRRELTVYDEFNAVNQRSYRVNLRRGLTLATVFPALNALAGIGTALLVYFGGLSVVSGSILLGSWYLFLQSLDSFWMPLMNLSSFWSQVQAGLSAIERIFALIDVAPEVIQRGAETIPELKGDIRFEQVGFRYATGEVVLPSFSLHVAAGETLALVGHTGAGKSSIARLVARFYEFQSGQLLIDGRDIRTLDLAEYRRHLGVVPQAPFLFSGTVADNVRYARPDAGEEEIERLSRRIGDGEWLAALPQGLGTDVGERGARLSMGQRQLVALMRVLLQKPVIFILDEATASIDPFTEAQIQEALNLILAESTSIVIAHRLSTVEVADRIIVMADGQILESGTHLDLMRAGGHYAELYDTYFRHQSPDYEYRSDGGERP
jgi:ATP-binding cassette, subfamily B, bacterial